MMSESTALDNSSKRVEENSLELYGGIAKPGLAGTIIPFSEVKPEVGVLPESCSIRS